MKYRRIGIGEYRSECGRVFIKHLPNSKGDNQQWQVIVKDDAPYHYATYADCKAHAERVLTDAAQQQQQQPEQPTIRAIKYLTVRRKKSACGVQYDIIHHKPIDGTQEAVVRGCGLNRLPLALRNHGGTWAVLPKGTLRITDAIAIVGTRAAAQLIADGLSDPCTVRDVGGLDVA